MMMIIIIIIIRQGWKKGVVFINGFNLGRYWHVGPQRTLYIPAPLMRLGDNQVPPLDVLTHGHPQDFCQGRANGEPRPEVGL